MSQHRRVKPRQTLEMYQRNGVIFNSSMIHVPPEMQKWTFDNPKYADKVDRINTFLTSKSTCTFTGKNGNYKTTLAYLTALQFLLTTEWYEEWRAPKSGLHPAPVPESHPEHHLDYMYWYPKYPKVAWVDWYDLCAEASKQAAFNDEASNLIDEYRNADLLIIDDISNQHTLTRFDTIEDIIKKRINTGLKTLITTNLDQAGLEKSLGPRVVDRLMQLVIVFNEESSRDRDVG